MLTQAVDRKRCASCEHWRGWRQAGEQAGTVIIESETSEGLCVGGGWDNSERRARSACGHWVCWDRLNDGNQGQSLPQQPQTAITEERRPP